MKVGDYVRTKNGTIVKIKDKDYLYVFETEYREEYKVVKSSPNIIDLIEVGDYVNGYKVLEILLHSPQLIFTTYKYYGHHYTKILNSEDIKTIVTKEQFESMEYRIGE